MPHVTICDGEDEEEVMQPYLCRRPATWEGHAKPTADADLPHTIAGCDRHFWMWSIQEPDAWASFTWTEIQRSTTA